MSKNSSNDSYIDHGKLLFSLNSIALVEDVDENVLDDPNNRSKDLQYMKSGRPISMLVNGATYQAQNNSSPARQ